MPKGTDIMDTAISVASEVAGVLPTHRQCSIQIKNKCSNYTLSFPSLHINSGWCVEMLPPTIDPSSDGKGLFSKTADTARGAVGVFTYDVVNKSTKEVTEKIAVMFSVPYDFNFYSNWFAVGVFGKDTKCDHDLYHNMYNNEENKFSRKKGGCCVSYKNDRITILATMSDSFQPDMKVEVSDS
ncbi:DELTA-sagatoxin-Srs1a-like [Seriola lalandi dorsalis]|uniref:DELTA-sagatoxin-Srs1a-like n=1 Tax=Seriola lalandi dorsalis TaxID=1841481 RepID=UPI000C6FA10C|nr:DELTA-sagatoxin-Srs1a-like [Seriola lalandi dorsalis]XP_056257362.1 DELTA-sagatoxin-Srs1a-like [Seriola aureovittata]XP_056257365.1 DELTA-sagatoxin-Srs1a-like [Seriola aureovittata]